MAESNKDNELEKSNKSVAKSTSDLMKKKLDSLFASNLHTDQDFIDMLEFVASMIGEVDLHAERRLLKELDDAKLKRNREYLVSFEKVNESVQSFANQIRQLNNICLEMTNRIQVNKTKTQDLLAKTTTLQAEKKVLNAKHDDLNEFFEKYSLSSEEEQALQGSDVDGTVDAKFFASLQRVKTIHADSKQLLRESGEHLAALEIMETMASKMESAYEVLYRSLQRECRLLNVEFLEIRNVVVQSVAALQDRPVLFQYAMEEYATARRNYIVRMYIDALTRGGSDGIPKPIELLSHDSLRYIGDMLAWMHQALVSEREVIHFLMKLCSEEVKSENVTKILNGITEALCRPFKVRVEQALANETNCIILYRLSCLFTFYAETMGQTLISSALILLILTELKELSLDMFFSGLKLSVEKILSKMNTPDYDLLPVHGIHQVLGLLGNVLESHDDVVADVADKKENFNKIFSAVLDPLGQSIQISAAQLHSPLDIAIYTLNCLSTILQFIALYQYTDIRLEMIKAQIDANEDVIVSEQVTSILNQTSLMDIYRKISAHQNNQGPLSEISGMEPAHISSSLVLFNSFLANPDNFSLEQCCKLSSARVRDSVKNSTVENLTAAYNVIYTKLVDEFNKYPTMNFKTTEQIRHILEGWK